MTSPLCQP